MKQTFKQSEMLPQALAIHAGLLVIFIFIPSLFFLHQKQLQRGGNKHPPGPKAMPIIGNLHMLGKLPHRTLQSLATRYGPIMSLKLGQVPAIVVSSPETAEIFLKTHDIVFASRPKLQAVDTLTYGRKGIVFSEYGGYWHSWRKLCTLQLLSASKVEMFAPLRKEELGLLVKSLKEAATSPDAVADLSELVGELVENITYKIILGRSEDHRFNIKGLIHEMMNVISVFNLADYVPFLAAFDLQEDRCGGATVRRRLDNGNVCTCKRNALVDGSGKRMMWQSLTVGDTVVHAMKLLRKEEEDCMLQSREI